MRKITALFLLILSVALHAQQDISIAGFYPLDNSGRMVYNFNPGWRFHKGDVQDAGALNFDDSAWEVVSTPHTVQLMPAEASGNRNYPGPAWYRKRLVAPAEAVGTNGSLVPGEP